MTQAFKPNDELEAKVTSCFSPTLNELGTERDSFYSGANTAFPLGDVLYLLNRDPMVGVILEETYRESFPEIHDLFTRPSTFEFYLNVLRSIWGEDANITFSIPNPGHLLIQIESLSLELQTFMARRIENNMYVYEPVLETSTGDTIVFQGTQGIKDQREADALIKEISAQGVFTEIELTIVE